jgi:uncharacterized protein (DUF983 family)
MPGSKIIFDPGLYFFIPGLTFHLAMSIIKSVFNMTCPRCRKGRLFTEPFKWSDPLAMPEKCAICGQRTEPEPGFYFGAMFISYIISGFVLLGISLGAVFIFGWSVIQAMALVLLIGALGYIRLLRLSRSIWIHLVVKYDPSTV